MSASDGARRGKLLAIAFVAVFAFTAFAGSVVARLALQDAAPSAGEERTSDLAEGQHPLYIVKEIVETSSDWTDVKWIQGPKVIVARHRVLEGEDAPELEYRVSGLTVSVAKSSFDTTRVVIEVEALVLEGDLTAVVDIEKGDIEYTRAEFYAYDRTAEQFTELAEILHDGVGPRDFELDLSTLYDMPSATANVEEAVEDLEKKVFAFYYPWYGSPSGPSEQWVHWPEGHAHYPLMGPYDSADEGVILAHMAMAKHAGVDGFIASWWGIESFTGGQMERILSVAEETGLKATIYYESVRDLTLEDIVGELSHVVNAHATSPAFLKDSGRPVLFIYAVSYAGRDAAFWLEVRRGVEANVGPVVLIGDTVDEGYLHVFDGFHTYIYLGDDVEGFYGDAVERLDSGLSSSEELDEAFSSAYSGGEVGVDFKPFSLTVIPGADFSAIGGNPDLFRDREGGDLYARYWGAAMTLDVHSVLITSWNEWHEGTEVEPSREYGFDYLALTRQFVEEYKQTILPTPEPSFSATVHPFEVYSDLKGNGSMVLATVTEVPALLATVEMRALDGAFNPDLQGAFYTYLKERNDTHVSVVIPSVLSLSELSVNATFTAEVNRPRLEVRIVVFEPSGNPHELFEGQLRILDVVVNEVELNPEGDDADNSIEEWVELYNPKTEAVDVGGWTLSTSFLILPIDQGTIIEPSEHLIVSRPSRWMANSDELVVLRDSGGFEVDRTPVLSDLDDDDRTWQRYPDGQDTDEAEDWVYEPSTQSLENIPEFPHLNILVFSAVGTAILFILVRKKVQTGKPRVYYSQTKREFVTLEIGGR